jgi:hypothetical protein
MRRLPAKVGGACRESRRLWGACQRPSPLHCVLTEGSQAASGDSLGGVEPGLARTRQADRVGRTPLVGPVHSVKCPRGLSSDPWDERTSVTAESQSTNIRRSPTILRAVSISATFRCSAPTRQTLQPVGERGQRHVDGFIELLELV